MKQIGRKGLCLLVGMVCVCFGLMGTATAAQEESWTVLLYLCGADLESEDGEASGNLEELLSVSVPSNIHCVVQTGGAAQWAIEEIDADSLQRWELTAEGLQLADTRLLASMGEAQTLGEFLRWGVECYPADHYMTLLWNHGGGAVSGVAFDELYDDDSLFVGEVAEGLAAAGVYFDVIGFDACLMATLETAAAVAPYGHYLVASEESEPGGGWDYAAWLEALCQNPAQDGLALGIDICDSYMQKCEREEEGDLVTLSVTDLTAVENVLAAFDAMAVEMTGVTGDITTYRELVQGVRHAENYGGNNKTDGYTNMVDLGDLAVNTESVLSDTALTVLDTLFEAVKYNVSGKRRSEANGLSVFYPLSVDQDELTAYAWMAATSGNYLRFLQAVTLGDWEVPEGIVDDSVAVPMLQLQDYAVDLYAWITDDGYFVLEIDGDMDSVLSVNFGLYYMDYDSSELVFLGLDNDINGDWDSGVFEDNFRGVWPTLDGCYCAPILLAEEDDYNLYTIPILLNGESTSLRAAYIWDDAENGHYEVYGAWAGIDGDTGMSARDLVPLRDGDEVTLLFDATNWDTDEEAVYRMDSFIVDGDVVMQEDALNDGEYMYQYIVGDVFGREFYSDSVIMECDQGDIYLLEE